MPVHFAIDPAARVVSYVVEGDATAAEARAFLDAVVTHPDYRRGFSLFGDRREVDRAPGGQYVHTLADLVNARRADLGPCRWAVVVADQAGYGMARMWEILTNGSGVDVRPFFSAEAAAAWLGLPAGYAPLVLVAAS